MTDKPEHTPYALHPTMALRWIEREILYAETMADPEGPSSVKVKILQQQWLMCDDDYKHHFEWRDVPTETET